MRLSGGQQQRVAIARALISKPRVLLLDEPLGALDLKLRKDMQQELKKIQKKTGFTFIFVTHDQEEALSMSDTIVVMSEGKIHQIGSPTDIYNEPKNAFVADFIGESNIVDGVMLEDRRVSFSGHTFDCVDSGFQSLMFFFFICSSLSYSDASADAPRIIKEAALPLLRLCFGYPCGRD